MFLRTINRIIIEVVLIAFAIIYFFPIYLVISTSFKTTNEYFDSPIGVPKVYHLVNFINAWQTIKFPLAFGNSFLVTSTSVVLLIFFGSLAAFPMARSRIKLSRIMYFYFISGIMLPFQTGMIPLVKMVKNLGLLNTRLALILVFAATNMALSVFLYTGFLKKVPKELEEAATIDGCNHFTVYRKVLFPMVKPVTVTVAIISSMSIWNDFIVNFLLVQNQRKRTIPPSVFIYFSKYDTNWGCAFATLLLAMLPLVIFYIIVQKQYVKGVMAGALKG